MFQKIMVGVDGSDSALRAVDAAARLAKDHDARLIMCHVVQISAIAEEALKVSATAHLEKEPKQIMERISQEILDAAKAHAVKSGLPEARIETFSADGNQASRLIEAATSREVDLVVVGSRGRGRLEGLLLGSVSQKIAALAPCACLIVK